MRRCVRSDACIITALARSKDGYFSTRVRVQQSSHGVGEDAKDWKGVYLEEK